MTSFVFHTSWADALRALPAEARLEVYDAIVAYAATGSVSDLSPVANMAFTFIRPIMDSDTAKAEDIRSKRVMAAKSRWGQSTEDDANACKCMQMDANGCTCMQMDANACKCMQMDANASPITLPQEEKSPITPKEDNPLIFPLEEETPTMVGAKKADPAELMEKRKQAFLMQLTPFFSRYGQAMCQDFSDYWTEPNRSRTKMRFELERTWDLARRLATWSKRDNSFSRHGPDNHQQRLQGYADVAAEFLGASKP